MVTNYALAALCIESGYYKLMINESGSLSTQIDQYAENITRARDLEYTVAENEGRPPGQYWVDIEPPKVGCVFPHSKRTKINSARIFHQGFIRHN